MTATPLGARKNGPLDGGGGVVLDPVLVAARIPAHGREIGVRLWVEFMNHNRVLFSA
jgi:hypothetical protein